MLFDLRTLLFGCLGLLDLLRRSCWPILVLLPLRSTKRCFPTWQLIIKFMSLRIRLQLFCVHEVSWSSFLVLRLWHCSCYRKLLLVIGRRTLEATRMGLQTRRPSKIRQTHLLRPLKKLQLFLSVQDLLIDLIHLAQLLRSRPQYRFCRRISNGHGLLHHHYWIYVHVLINIYYYWFACD